MYAVLLVLALMGASSPAAVAPSDGETLAIRWAPVVDTGQDLFFHDDTPDGNILLQAGWGAGKTTTLWAKMLKLSALNYPLRGIWTVPNYDHVLETVIPALEATDPRTGDPWFLKQDQFHYSQSKHLLTWIGGGDLLFKTAERPRSIAGPNVAFAGTDEPGSIKHEAWRNTCARVRDPRATLRQKIAAGTPEGITYLLDYFGPDRSEKYKLYVMRTDENTHLTADNPEFIAQMKATMTEAEVMAYLEGRAVNITGSLAHPTFDPELHWREGIPLVRDLPLRVTFDFNVDPMSCVVGQQVAGPAGPEARVVDCVAIYGGATVMDVCEELVKRYPSWSAGLVIYGDCNGRNRSTVSNQTNYDIIKERLAKIGPLSLKVPTANPAVKARLNAVNVLFKNALGQSRLFIRKTEPAVTCSTRVLVRSLQMTKKKSGTDDIEKKSGETHTHHSEALGYWIAQEFPVTRQSGAAFASVGWV